MQELPLRDDARLARVIPLAGHRRARRTNRRRKSVNRTFMRVLVAVWFGALFVGAAALLAALIVSTIRHGLPGILALIAVAALAAWPLAGRWMRGWRPRSSGPGGGSRKIRSA